MTRKVFSGLMVGAAISLGLLPGPARAACTLQQIASVDVYISENGAVLVPVKVNGQGAWMTLGMDSGLPIVRLSAAQQLGLKLLGQGDVEFKIGGVRVTQKTVVDSLLVGSVRFTKWDFYVDPDPSPLAPFQGLPVVGLLTSRFTNALDMELNLAQRKLNLFRPTDHCNGQQVYWGGEVTSMNIYHDPSGLLVFPMEINGKGVEASLHTEGSTSQISETVAKRFFGFDRNSQGITREATAYGNGTAFYRAMNLTAKGLAMENVKIQLYDDLKFGCVPTTEERDTHAIGFKECANLAPLSIGTDLLRQLRIYIAPKEGKIYITHAAEPVPATDAAPRAAGPAAPVADGAAVPPAGAATAGSGADQPAAGSAPAQ